MTTLKNIIERYRSLPDLPFRDKIKFALLRGFYKDFLSRKIIDTDCQLRQSRYKKAELVNDRCSFEKLICLGGFGWSGSGAVLDLLDEYDHVTVSVKMPNGESFVPEFDLIRIAGGLFDLERAFTTENIYIRDVAIRMYMALCKYLYVNIKAMFGEGFIAETRKFLDQIVAFKGPSRGEYGFSPHLSGLGHYAETLVFGDCPVAGTKGYVYYLKPLSVSEYRAIAKDYLLKLLSMYPSERFMVLDQPLADYSGDIVKYEEYLGPMRLINIYRDPRDVYAMKKLHPDLDWLPDNPDNFIFWYRSCLAPSLKVSHPDYMLMPFEKVILEYDKMVARIEQFCGIDAAWHTRAKTKFDPAVSCKNIGIYKQFANDPDMIRVGNELKEFCYHALKIETRNKLCND